MRGQRGDGAASGGLRIPRRRREDHEARTRAAGKFDQTGPDCGIVVTQGTTDGTCRAGRGLDRRGGQ